MLHFCILAVFFFLLMKLSQIDDLWIFGGVENYYLQYLNKGKKFINKLINIVHILPSRFSRISASLPPLSNTFPLLSFPHISVSVVYQEFKILLRINPCMQQVTRQLSLWLRLAIHKDRSWNNLYRLRAKKNKNNTTYIEMNVNFKY